MDTHILDIDRVEKIASLCLAAIMLGGTTCVPARSPSGPIASEHFADIIAGAP